MNDGLQHPLFLPHIQMIILQKTSYFLCRELQELLRGGSNFLKATQKAGESLLSQLRSVVGISKHADADAVLWAQLFLQVVTAGLYDPLDIKLVGRYKKLSYVGFWHVNTASVGKLNNEPHHVC